MQIVIAPDAPYLRGHFPGRPILPGVVQLALVVEHLAHEGGRPLKLRSIKFARLRQLVVPGDRLDVAARSTADGFTRVDVMRDGVLVANAELELSDAPDANPGPRATPVAGATVAAPPLDVLLRHRPPMRLITSIEREVSEGLQCDACVSSECGLVNAGHAPALLALEAAAQSAAAWEALLRSREGADAGARMGYLVAIRDTQFYAAEIPGDETFSTTVRLEALALPLTHYAVEVALRGEVVLRGMIATVLADRAS
jgi:3-hydroxymyristoyl/3-hydroxydecanoyl-(acyl carrier protein) dehydratase